MTPVTWWRRIVDRVIDLLYAAGEQLVSCGNAWLLRKWR